MIIISGSTPGCSCLYQELNKKQINTQEKKCYYLYCIPLKVIVLLVLYSIHIYIYIYEIFINKYYYYYYYMQ